MEVGEVMLFPSHIPVSADVELPSIGIVLRIEDPLPIAKRILRGHTCFTGHQFTPNSSVISSEEAVGSASRYEMSIR